MAAMIYAQSRSELQTIISMPSLEMDYSSNGNIMHQLMDDATASTNAAAGTTMPNSSYHQQALDMDGPIMCNYSSSAALPEAGNSAVYNNISIDGAAHHNVLDSPEHLPCIPLPLADIPAVSLGYDEAVTGNMPGTTPAVLDDNLEQSVDDIYGLELQNPSEVEAGVKGLSWQAFLVDSWYTMCDLQLLEISHDEIANGLVVETDKGFNFSPWDESFVCQKKNHFQISVQLRLQKIPKYIKTENHEIEHIRNFAIHLYGVKFETPATVIPIEQSKTDRSKLPYEPVILDFPTQSDQIVKASACRLHFSETTANNMRKRGKPNPDQKYFSLVVAIHAYTGTCDYPVVAYVSERIIVRASNPGQFDNEGDSTWMKSGNSDCVYYNGRVGVNTESPEEALSVVGNVSVTGNILHPSDRNLKQNITKMHTKDMLENVCKMTLYSYSFKPNAFKSKSIIEKKAARNIEVGLIAQEVQSIIPDAIHELNFQGNSHVQMINKDRILMEVLGAVQELCRERVENKTVPFTMFLFVAAILVLFFSLIL